MRTIFFLLLSVLAGCSPSSQTADKYLQSGNELYKLKDYERASLDYTKAIDLDHKKSKHF